MSIFEATSSASVATKSSFATEVIAGYSPSVNITTCGINNGTNGTANSTTGPNLTNNIIVLAVTFALAVIGNGGVIVVLLPRWKKLARVHHFMLNLGIVDMFVAFWTILSLMLEVLQPSHVLTVGGDPLCKFLSFMAVFPMHASSYMLVMCAVDRFIAICYPLKNYSWTNKRTYMLVALAWGIGFLLAFPQFFVFSSQYNEKLCSYMCTDIWNTSPEYARIAYTFYYIGVNFFIPLIILVVTYGCIAYTVWVNLHSKMKTNNKKESGSKKCASRKISVISQDSTTSNGASDSGSRHASDVRPRTHSMRDFSRAKLKTLAMMFVVVGAFIICLTPFSVMMAWYALDKKILRDKTIAEVNKIVQMLAYLNSCCNPYIYLVFNYKIIKRFFFWRKKKSMKFQGRPTTLSSTSMNSVTQVTLVSESAM